MITPETLTRNRETTRMKNKAALLVREVGRAANQKKGVSIDVELERELDGLGYSCLIIELIKYVMYESSLIPLSYDQMIQLRKRVSNQDDKGERSAFVPLKPMNGRIHAPQRSVKTGGRSTAEPDSVFIESAEVLFRTITSILSNPQSLHSINQVLVLLGPAPNTNPRHALMINLPPVSPCSSEKESKSRTQSVKTLLRSLIVEDFLHSAKISSSSGPTTLLSVMIFAPRGSAAEYRSAGLLPCLSFNLSSLQRLGVHSINCLAKPNERECGTDGSGVGVQEGESFEGLEWSLYEMLADMSGIEPFSPINHSSFSSFTSISSRAAHASNTGFESPYRNMLNEQETSLTSKHRGTVSHESLHQNECSNIKEYDSEKITNVGTFEGLEMSRDTGTISESSRGSGVEVKGDLKMASSGCGLAVGGNSSVNVGESQVTPSSEDQPKEIRKSEADVVDITAGVTSVLQNLSLVSSTVGLQSTNNAISLLSRVEDIKLKSDDKIELESLDGCKVESGGPIENDSSTESSRLDSAGVTMLDNTGLTKVDDAGLTDAKSTTEKDGNTDMIELKNAAVTDGLCGSMLGAGSIEQPDAACSIQHSAPVDDMIWYKINANVKGFTYKLK